MKANQQIIWINVTTSANWNRPVVGVVRVESELKRHLQRLYPEGFVKECIWLGNQFVEYLDKQELITEAVKSEVKDPVQNKEPNLLYPVLPRRVALEMIAQGFLSIMPAKLRPIVSRFLLISKRKIARILASKNYHRIRAGISREHSSDRSTVSFKNNHQESLFNAGDVLISVGLDWEDPGLLEEFSRLKEQEAVRIVTCCYDLIPCLFPQYCVSDVATRFAQYFIDLANNSDLILCISRQSENDLKQLLNQTGAAQVETQVFQLGDNVPEAKDSMMSDEIKSILTEPFILFVSTIERRKNHQVLYQAYHLLCQQGKKAQLPKLVFVGMAGWGVDDLLRDIQLDPLTQGLILQCNHVTDAELRSLYDAALCCVYPSLYEGWGLPVGEALALGKIVLSSDRGSLPEVGGDLVTYIDPWNPADWAAQIWRVTTDLEYQKTLREKVKSSYQSRSWQGVARSIKPKLDELIEKPFTTQILYPGYDFMSEVGKRIGPVIRSNGKAGILFTGPNKAMPAGAFRVTIWDEPDVREVGRYKLSFLVGNNVIAEQANLAIQQAVGLNTPLITMDFHLENPVNSLNVQCQLISGELSIVRLEIKAQ